MTRRQPATGTNANRRQVLFSEITDARGGLQVLTETDIAIAKACARLLAVDDINPRDAAVASELMARLPAKRDEPPADLTRLSDHQLDTLARIMAVARAEVPPPNTVRKQSLRWRDAKRLCAVLDRAETRGKLLDHERTELQNLLHFLLVPVVPIAYQLWPSPVAQISQTPQPPAIKPTPSPPLPPPEPAANDLPPSLICTSTSKRPKRSALQFRSLSSLAPIK
ncbi:MAG: hypothetical protein WCC81_22940 [Pseudolabrys sp.]